MQGFLLIDKPAGMTSHDVVDRVRRLTGERRVGHAGTLDPFATGLLIVGVGRAATREMYRLVGLDKEYEAVFVLGASSTTDDVEGEITDAPLRHSEGVFLWTEEPPRTRSREVLRSTKNSLRMTEWAREKMGGLQEVLQQFIGEIEQVPPTYSAIKIGGKKMYEEARAGRPMEAKARQVTIYSLELHNHPQPLLEKEGGRIRIALTIRCSSGTYIRALARDLGRALGGGGYVEELRRTQIGSFSIQEAHTLELLQTRTQELLIPVETLLSRL